MFNVDANLKHVNTHEYTNWRLVSTLCLFCSVSLVSSSFDSLHITLWLKCLNSESHSISRSSPCLMRTLSDSLFDPSIYFTFFLFIIFSFQHFLLLFTFLEVSRQQACALPLRSRVPRTTSSPPQRLLLVLHIPVVLKQSPWLVRLSFLMLMILVQWILRLILNHLSQCQLGARLCLCIFDIGFQLRILEMTKIHQWRKMNFSALSPCFIDHFFLVSDFGQLPCRNFLQFFPFFPLQPLHPVFLMLEASE